MESHIKADIHNKQYLLKSEVEPAYLEYLASLVNRKMDELSAILPGADRDKILVLTALNFADEIEQYRLMGSESDEAGDERHLEQRTQNMISMLEKGIIGNDL